MEVHRKQNRSTAKRKRGSLARPTAKLCLGVLRTLVVHSHSTSDTTALRRCATGQGLRSVDVICARDCRPFLMETYGVNTQECLSCKPKIAVPGFCHLFRSCRVSVGSCVEYHNRKPSEWCACYIYRLGAGAQRRMRTSRAGSFRLFDRQQPCLFPGHNPLRHRRYQADDQCWTTYDSFQVVDDQGYLSSG
jgi:hypothetical protein